MSCQFTIRSTILVVLLGLSSTLASASPDPEPLKWNVVRVRPVYHDKIRRTFDGFANLFRSLSEELKRKGQVGGVATILDRLSTYYKTQAGSPWHGSGWIYFPSNAKTAYVITNKHIAGQAASVYLEFEGQRHAPISETSVIYTDPRYDIAIIEVARSRLPKETTGFQIASAPPTEASEVWSVGFPGYGDSAVFALTFGHVSSAAIPADDGARYIAHSATAERGNSGGPLLFENPMQATGFRVAGMNAWRIIDTTNVNVAIPAEILRRAIDAAERAEGVSRNDGMLKDALHASAKRLAAELGSSRPDVTVLSSMVSYTFVSQRPEVMASDLLKLVQGKMTEDEQQRFEQSPVEYSRETLLQLFRDTFATGASSVDAVKFEHITDEDRISTTKDVRSVFTVAGKRQEIFWTWEHGTWRIADASFDQVFEDKRKEIDTGFRALGLVIALSTLEVTAQADAKHNSELTKNKPAAETAETTEPVYHSARGNSLAVWASQGRRGAISENFQSSLERKQFSAFGVEFGFPFNHYFWFSLGLGYGPLGVTYQVTDGNRSIEIDEYPAYLTVPALLRLEIPIETRYATVRLFGKAGLAGDLRVQEDGSLRDTMTGTRSSLADPNLHWFENHNRVNVGTLYGGGIEIGLGASPSVYVGAEVVAEQHLLKEWGSDAFAAAANYRYETLRWGVVVKYQALH